MTPVSRFVVKPNEEDEVISCSCCAGMPGVRGFVYEGEEALAVYFAEPSGMINFPMLRLGLVVGLWAGDTMASDRVSVAWSVRPGPVLEPIDPYLPTFPEMSFLGTAVMKDDLLGHVDVETFREIARAVIAEDPRLGEMRGRGKPRHRTFVADSPDGSGR